MGRRPVYLKNKSGAYWLMTVLFGFLLWLLYSSANNFSLDDLVEKSELKGRSFQGKAEELTASQSGLRAYFMQEESNPLVAVSFIFDGRGSAYDGEGNEGLANLAAMTMLAGAGFMDAETLREELSSKGIKIAFSADKDNFSGQMLLPKAQLVQGSSYLRDILSRPQFSKVYVERVKAQVLKALETEKESPATELSLAFNKFIYGDHPYGRNPLGTEDAVMRVNGKLLKDFVRSKLGKNGLYIGIAGDLTRDEAVNLVDEIFGNLPAETDIADIGMPNIDWNRPKLVIERNSGQNMAAFAVKGTCRKCPDFYPLYLANYLFGGAGLNSKLNQKIREQEGLTYGGYSAVVLNDKSDLLTAGFSATQDKFAKAVALFAAEWHKIAENGFSREELQKAKNYLTASYNLRFSSISGIADILAYMQKYNLGLDFLQKRNGYVEAVTLPQLNKAAKAYFTDKMLQAEMGNFGGEK